MNQVIRGSPAQSIANTFKHTATAKTATLSRKPVVPLNRVLFNIVVMRSRVPAIFLVVNFIALE